MLALCYQAVNITGMTYTNYCENSVKNPDDGKYICPKHVEFITKNKFVKQCTSLAFIIRIYHDAQSSECQNSQA